MSKEEKEQISQKKPLLVTTPEVGALVWKEAFLCPSRGCAAREVYAAKEIVLVLSMQHLCTHPLYNNRQRHKVTMATNKTKGKTHTTQF